MYQSHVYLEVRILIPESHFAFLKNKEIPSVSIEKPVFSKLISIVHALGAKYIDHQQLDSLTSKISFPDKNSLTGYSLLIGTNGKLNIEFHSRKKEIEIEEIRLEEDAGRLTHSNGQTRMDYTYVGMPSIRIKTSSAFELGEEAELFLNELKRLVQYL